MAHSVLFAFAVRHQVKMKFPELLEAGVKVGTKEVREAVAVSIHTHAHFHTRACACTQAYTRARVCEEWF